MADELDLAVVKRMMELQLKMMAEDPEQAFRDPVPFSEQGPESTMSGGTAWTIRRMRKCSL